MQGEPRTPMRRLERLGRHDDRLEAGSFGVLDQLLGLLPIVEDVGLQPALSRPDCAATSSSATLDMQLTISGMSNLCAVRAVAISPSGWIEPMTGRWADPDRKMPGMSDDLRHEILRGDLPQARRRQREFVRVVTARCTCPDITFAGVATRQVRKRVS